MCKGDYVKYKDSRKRANILGTFSIVLLCLLVIESIILINTRKNYTEAYETACALSDIIRIHTDCEPEFEESVKDYTDNLDCMNYTINSINWNKYCWCY